MERDNTFGETNNFDIAVIGMAGRFPGAKNIDEFWQGLYSGRESVTFFTDEELKESGIDPALLANPSYIKAGAILENPELFDASFFRYSPREAEMMDPQHRLFLECAWEAVEQAGYDTDRYPGAIGVYAGASPNTYLLYSGLISRQTNLDLPILITNERDYLTTRVSYKMNLKGPSVNVQTACSTSLVAIHMACQSLLNGECDMALAGGTSVRFPYKIGYLYQPGNIPSPDGHCRAFDEKAEGTISGNGVGVVLLKRLTDAIVDGDYIQAVIKGSAINNDGHLKVDYTSPSVEGQSQVIVEAIANARVAADSISFIEAHGTGTSLGDPIEVSALTRAFRNYTDKNGFCAIGSVKTNVGHLDAAAGVTGFIKTVMALKHRMIPPTLHFQKANPRIDFKNSPFYVNNKLMAWEAQYPRRAGVSSFGIGGTNAHLILEEAPVIEASGESRPWQLLLLSARTDAALEAATINLVEYLKGDSDINLADAAYTLQVGRKAFNHRRILVCRDINDAIQTLEERDVKRIQSSLNEAVQRDVVFIFSGQGSQYVNMGLDLYRSEPVFREEMDRCFEILRSQLGMDLHDIIYPDGPVTEELSNRLTQTGYTQPALFSIEYALARLWMSWGVKPTAMVGHSIGEYVAACLAGVFSLEDALKLVAARGRLMQEMPGGAMLAVFLSEEELQPFLNDELALAVVNLPSLCVVSGEYDAVATLEKRLSEKKILCRHVRTSHAFHSKMMDPIIDKFAEQVKQVVRNAPEIRFASNMSGTWITPEEATEPEYWARHLRRTVRYSDCIRELLKEPDRILLEVGPGNTFSTLARQHPDAGEQIMLSSTRHPKEDRPDVAYILNTLGQIWMAGGEVDWSGFYQDEMRHRVPLPTYPFERQAYVIMSSQPVPGISPAGDTQSRERDAAQRSAVEQLDRKLVNVPGDYETDIEQGLAEIWRDLLGVKEVKNTDNFFDLGGTSLLAVSLFAEIEKKFGKRLPLAALMTAPNIELLAGLIKDEKAPVEWNSLVEIQPSGSRPPLFLIHAAGGNLLIYRDLIRHLRPDQPVYGLQAQGFDGKQPILSRIEDMATQYIKEIQAVCPEGPYLLAGYCLGGTVALEMAQQLHTQGKEVSLVALMETYNFANQTNTLFDKIQYRMQQVEFHVRNFFLADQKMTFFKEKAKVAWNRKDVIFGAILAKIGLQSRASNGRNVWLSKIWQACDLAAITYIPKAYPGRITEFRPLKEYATFSGPELGWEKLATGGLETYTLKVYPRGMLVEPFVTLVAEKLEICIENVSRIRQSVKK
jgi:phthiocerol/phenolphthiocerol synthesis type-I polyketide synthase E